MNVKIQGGGSGKYANTGSSFGALQYLNHENEMNLAEKGQIEPFFDHEAQDVDFGVAVRELDHNKAKLSQKDAKFFAITISPSEKELSKMGSTEAERSAAMKAYTRDVMDEYAKNYGKGLRGEDLLYYAKIHHNREEKEGMHAHVIVSRKSKNNKVKLSPKTNHRSTGRSGTVRSSFDRTNFFKNCEDEFDKKFNYERQYTESFEYQNAMKNGTFQEKEAAVKQSELTPNKTLLQELRQEQLRIDAMREQEKNQEQSLDKKIIRNQEQKQDGKQSKGRGMRF